MFYELIDKMDYRERDAYMWKEVDGKPLYRWYKYALNSVYMISSVDEVRDIENVSFDDLDPWYESVVWVAKNDPEALVYIMSELIDPVTDIVKQKLLENLKAREYYTACDIVKKNLASFPVPPERTFARKKEQAIKIVEKNIADKIYSSSMLLSQIKKMDKKKLYEKDVQEPLNSLLNIERYADNYLDDNLEYIEWLLENAPEDLQAIFTKEICLEVKDNFLDYLSKKEYYHLCQFFSENLKEKEMSFYYKILPYTKKMQESGLFEDEEDEDE